MGGMAGAASAAHQGRTGWRGHACPLCVQVGVPGSLMAYGVIVSLGYVLMKAVGF